MPQFMRRKAAIHAAARQFMPAARAIHQKQSARNTIFRS
jgi:hypothetical protein